MQSTWWRLNLPGRYLVTTVKSSNYYTWCSTTYEQVSAHAVFWKVIVQGMVVCKAWWCARQGMVVHAFDPSRGRRSLNLRPDTFHHAFGELVSDKRFIHKGFWFSLILFSLTLIGRAFIVSDFQAKCWFFMCWWVWPLSFCPFPFSVSLSNKSPCWNWLSSSKDTWYRSLVY